MMTTPEVAVMFGVKPVTVRSTARNARKRGAELRWAGERPEWADNRTALWDREAVEAWRARRAQRRTTKQVDQQESG